MTAITFLDRDSFEQNITIKKPTFTHEWINHEGTTAEQTIERCGNSEIIVTNKVLITRDVLAACPAIKHIAVTATGYNIIDIDACREHSVSVSNIPSYATTTVSEHVLACALDLRRQLSAYRQHVLSGTWQESSLFCLFKEPIHDLNNTVFGIVGYGSLGEATAKLMQAVGMKVIYSSRSNKPSDYGAQVSFEELISTADIVSLHCPLTAETENLIDAKELAAMQNHAILINTARGGIVNERAFADAIKAGEIGGGAFDVLCEEPPKGNSSPLFEVNDRPNVILTPHIGWASQEAMQTLSDQVISNIQAFHSGKPINIVS